MGVGLSSYFLLLPICWRALTPSTMSRRPTLVPKELEGFSFRSLESHPPVKAVDMSSKGCQPVHSDDHIELAHIQQDEIKGELMPCNAHQACPTHIPDPHVSADRCSHS